MAQGGPKLSVEAMVLIKDKNLPCNQWALGKVIKVYLSDDGAVRAATVKTAHEEIERAAKYLCLLPIERNIVICYATTIRCSRSTL